jgi:deazaflavin-dependent oxidoreductase (nitroreductase family)
MEASHYKEPGRFTTKVMNPFVVLLMKLGISVWGSRTLEVVGRASGLPRRTPVNLLEVEGRQYLVAPRGHAQWVRNARAAGGRLALLLGRRRQEYVAHELTDREKTPILRAYLRRWKMEVGVFFGGVTADSSEQELLAIAANHPVFLLEVAR